MIHDFQRNVLRHTDTHLILRHVARLHRFLRQRSRGKYRVYRRLKDVHAIPSVCLVDREHIAVLCDVRFHVHTEAVVKTMAAADQDILYFLAASLIKPVVLASVAEIHLIEALHGLQVAAPKKDERRSEVDIRLLALLFRKEEERLRERGQRLLCGVIRLRLELYLPALADFVVDYRVDIEEATRTLFPHRREEAVLFPKFFQCSLKSFFRQNVTHENSSFRNQNQFCNS